MPLAGTIDSDFSEFVGECQKADAGLAAIQDEAAKTEVAINEMGSSAATTVDTTGVAVEGMGAKASKSASGFTTLAGGLRTADKTLGAFGISVNKEIGLLEELGQVASASAGSIGLLGQASIVAATAIGAWKVGRMIAEVTGADDAIAEMAATMTGQGSVAMETMRARIDTVRLAIQRGGDQVKTYDEAIKFNAEWVKKNSEQYNTAAHRVAEWERALAKLGPKQSELRREIESGNSTTAEMVQHYGVSARAIEYLTTKIDAEKDARKAANAESQKHADALQDLTAARKGEAGLLAEVGAANVAAIKGYLDLGASQSTLATAYGLTAAQVRAVADAYKAEKEAGEESARSAKERAAQVAAAAKFVSDLTTEYAREQADAQATAQQKQLLSLGTWRAEQMASLAATKGASVAQYEEVARVYNEKLQAMTKSHAGAVQVQMSEDEKAFQAQLATQAKAIKHAQDYGVTLAQAYKDLGMSGQESFGLVAAGADAAKGAIGEATAQVQHMSVALVDLGAKNRTAWESIEAGKALEQAYRDAGIFVGMQGGAMTGYQAQRRERQNREPATDITGGALWGTGQGSTSTTTNLNVNVNNAQAGDIAQQLVTEMRHQGVRL